MNHLKEIESVLLQGFRSGNLTTDTVLVSIVMSLLFGAFIYYIYRTNCRSSFYDRDFNKALSILPCITASIMLAMQSNILISLGMVGALSVIRFRNAVKNSIDLTYLFWSITTGIIVGMGLFKLAVIASVCISLMLFGMDLLPTFRAPYILVVTGHKELSEGTLIKCVKQYSDETRICSRNVSAKSTEWIIELKTKEAAKLVADVSELAGTVSANLLSHDGDVRY